MFTKEFIKKNIFLKPDDNLLLYRLCKLYDANPDIALEWVLDESDDISDILSGILAYLPKAGLIITWTEGTGDNLLPEDCEEGYVDYVNYQVYKIHNTQIREFDCGMMMLRNYYSELYKNDSDAAYDVVKYATDELDISETDAWIIGETQQVHVDI